MKGTFEGGNASRVWSYWADYGTVGGGKGRFVTCESLHVNVRKTPHTPGLRKPGGGGV